MKKKKMLSLEKELEKGGASKKREKKRKEILTKVLHEVQ